MPAGPSVSVVMAAYDASRFLPAAIAQLEAQTHRDLEVVVVDDASQDDTPEQLAAWAARDPRVRVLRSPDRLGVARAAQLGGLRGLR